MPLNALIPYFKCIHHVHWTLSPQRTLYIANIHQKHNTNTKKNYIKTHQISSKSHYKYSAIAKNYSMHSSQCCLQCSTKTVRLSSLPDCQSNSVIVDGIIAHANALANGNVIEILRASNSNRIDGVEKEREKETERELFNQKSSYVLLN